MGGFIVCILYIFLRVVSTSTADVFHGAPCWRAVILKKTCWRGSFSFTWFLQPTFTFSLLQGDVVGRTSDFAQPVVVFWGRGDDECTVEFNYRNAFEGGVWKRAPAVSARTVCVAVSLSQGSSTPTRVFLKPCVSLHGFNRSCRLLKLEFFL